VNPITTIVKNSSGVVVVEMASTGPVKKVVNVDNIS